MAPRPRPASACAAASACSSVIALAGSLAEEMLDPGAYGYFAGGAGDELTLEDNIAAFRRIKLRPRMLVDVTNVTSIPWFPS